MAATTGLSCGDGQTGSRKLDDIVAVIGWDAMLMLVRRFGGQRIFIPAKQQAGSTLVKTVGEDCARLICDYYFNTEIYFPIALRREAEIRALAQITPPLTLNEIAHRCGISYRGVQKILDRRPKAVMLGDRDRGQNDNRQPGLFDQ